MVTIERMKKRTRLVNPQKRVSEGTRSAAPAAKQNPELITLGALINPQRGSSMKKLKSKSKSKKTAARKPNPVVVFRPAAKHSNGKRRARKSNPNIFGTGKEMIESGAYALAGLVATRQLPQLLLKEKNAGWKGYFANAAAAIASAFATAKFAGPKAANDVLIGGGLYLVNRVLTEQVSPMGKVLSMSGVGDAAAASTMGRVRPDYFPLPVQRDAQGNAIIPQAITDAVMRQLPAPASKVSGVSRKMAPRFAA